MAEERVDRRLAAILAGDIAGYSQLMAADEEGTLRQLKSHRLELVDPKITEHRGRIVNTHPALLPRHGGKGLYGGHVHEAVIAAGERTTGVSVHLVDGDYDTGRVIAQCEIPVEERDDATALAARVQAVERRFLVQVLQGIAGKSIAL